MIGVMYKIGWCSRFYAACFLKQSNEKHTSKCDYYRTHLWIFLITTLHKIFIKLISVTKNLKRHILILGRCGIMIRVDIMWQPGVIRRNLCIVYRKGNIYAVLHRFFLHGMNLMNEIACNEC